MQVSLSPEAAEPLKTKLVAISTTILNLSMPSWGTNTARPGGLSPYWPAAYPVLGHSTKIIQYLCCWRNLNIGSEIVNVEKAVDSIATVNPSFDNISYSYIQWNQHLHCRIVLVHLDFFENGIQPATNV